MPRAIGFTKKGMPLPLSMRSKMSFPLEAAASRGGLNEGRPKLWAFLKRIHQRPAYQRALEKGGKYELLR